LACGEQKGQNASRAVPGNHRRQISAKLVGVGAVFQLWILAGEQPSLLTRIAATVKDRHTGDQICSDKILISREKVL